MSKIYKCIFQSEVERGLRNKDQIRNEEITDFDCCGGGLFQARGPGKVLPPLSTALLIVIHSLPIGKTKTIPKFYLSACTMRVCFSHAHGHFKAILMQVKSRKLPLLLYQSIGMIGLVYNWFIIINARTGFRLILVSFLYDHALTHQQHP